MSRSAGQIAAITAATALTGLVGYAVYFDYMRRNSADFRKGLKKQHKQIKAAAEARIKEEKEKNTRLVRDAAREITSEIPPSGPEQQEAYFQEQVAEGEKLAAMGPEQYVASAKAFFRAMRVYPQPVELMMIYQKVCPPPVFALFLEIVELSGALPGAGGGGGGQGPIPIPSGPGASVADIDDGSSSANGSGGDWDKVSQ